MELPKNITQIGEAAQHCRVYVEDYVVSYIKQMNRLAENRNMAIALYGVHKEENGAAYVFFYGAAKINSIQKEVRHLSQAQNQEIEKLRKRYFSDYDFLGYRMLDGEMVEGFHICEQGTCRYIKGYACFYEKNDVMLAYMLDSRKEEVPPETVDQEKFERVKRRQEERRTQYREGTLDKKTDENKRQEQKNEKRSMQGADKRRDRERKLSLGNKEPRKNNAHGSFDNGRQKGAFNMMKMAVAAVFLLLCVLGIAGINDFGGMEAIQTAGKQLIAEFTEQKLPDSQEQQTSGQSNTLVTEDKLTDAIQQENSAQTQATSSAEQQTGSQENSQTGEEASAAVQNGTPNGAQTESEGTSQASEWAETNAGETESTATEDTDNGTAAEGTNDGVTVENTNDEATVGGAGNVASETPEESSVQASAPVAYIIKKGDTLTSISVNAYGTDSRVKDICDLNGIEDPDDIRFGQKILLP